MARKKPQTRPENLFAMLTLTSLEDLKPAPYNPRRIDPSAAKGLESSLENFGDISGIVWNATSGHVVCGHQRLAALKAKHGDKLTLKRGQIVTPDGKSFSVHVVEWDDAKEKAANVAANNQHIAGEFTSDVLSLLESLEDTLPEFADLRLDILGEDMRRLLPDLAPPIGDSEDGDSSSLTTCPFCKKEFRI